MPRLQRSMILITPSPGPLAQALHFRAVGAPQQILWSLNRFIQNVNLVTQPEILPSHQRDGRISVLPQIVVERSQVESVSLMEASVREEFDDLELANLIGNRLARC